MENRKTQANPGGPGQVTELASDGLSEERGRDGRTENGPSTEWMKEKGPGGILEDVLSRSMASSVRQGVVIGTFCGWNQEGIPEVRFPNSPGDGPVPARTIVPLGETDLEQEVALLFEENNPASPVVIGLIQPTAVRPEATVDHQNLVLEAHQRIELRCGKAKVVLTKDGRVLVKGTDVMSRSEGPNRLKGASIQIN